MNIYKIKFDIKNKHKYQCYIVVSCIILKSMLTENKFLCKYYVDAKWRTF